MMSPAERFAQTVRKQRKQSGIELFMKAL